MALKSTNIANTLLQTLGELTARGDQLVLTPQHASVVGTLRTICTILVDSAEAVAEGTADPDARNRTFDYARRIREEAIALDGVVKGIQTNPSDPNVKRQLLSSAHAIATFTAEIAAISDDLSYRKVTEGATGCAGDAKRLITSTTGTYMDFFEACKAFGGSSLNFARVLQEYARGVQDTEHQQKVVNSYTMIKEMGPTFIRAAKKAYEAQGQGEPAEELKVVSRQLASKIGYALSVCQPDGGQAANEVSATQPVMPLPQVDQVQALPTGDAATQRPSTRRKTIVNPTVGKEVLMRARTATIARQVNDEVEQAWNAPPAAAAEPEPPIPQQTQAAWGAATKPRAANPSVQLGGGRAALGSSGTTETAQPAPVAAEPAKADASAAGRAFDTEEAESIIADYERDMGSVSEASAPAAAATSSTSGAAPANDARVAELEQQLATAQAKIKALEVEVEGLQTENDQLHAMTESMRKRLAARA